MKAKLLIGILFLLFSASLYAQNDLLGYKPRQIKFKQPFQPLLVPSLSSPSYAFVLGEDRSISPQTCVYKSPVHHTAFFCKMEVKTQNTLGIMIKVHAGDYDKYTTGTEQPQP